MTSPAPRLPALRRLPAWLAPRRAWPHREGLAVEARDPGGRVVALVVTDDEIRLLPGRDRALPALAPATARGGELLGHRPGRRAVLRDPGGDYLKVVRPGRAHRVADGLDRAAALVAGRAGAPMVPAVLARDDRAGWVRLAPLPGPSLHGLLRTDAVAAESVSRQVRQAIAALQDAPPTGLPRHTHADEADVLRRWVDDADGWAGTDLAEHLPAVTGRLRSLPEPRWVPCHRDLHDRQILASGRGTVGLLDLDTLCAADPALDPANLLAHLELRTLQGHTPAATATRCATAVADRPGPVALAAYTAAALLRLAAVYTFRPGPPGLPARLAAAARAAAADDTAGRTS